MTGDAFAALCASVSVILPHVGQHRLRLVSKTGTSPNGPHINPCITPDIP
ncbi:MAG: hypothetical protein O7D94_02990 [Planctomycetota bacterium]|nr:hypothetical protein [Planctomycetota bacterium]MCZ6697879.1 hypothetical protein [Planctomycetota bacterium]